MPKHFSAESSTYTWQLHISLIVPLYQVNDPLIRTLFCKSISADVKNNTHNWTFDCAERQGEDIPNFAPHHPHDDSYSGINGRTGATKIMSHPPSAHRPQTLQSDEQKPRDQARIQIKAPHRTINTHPKENQISLHEEEQAVAAPINGGRKREETKESTKWEKNPKRVNGSRKNRIANRVKNKPDLEKVRGREGSALPAAMAAAPWNRRSRARAQLERKRRGEERPQWRIIVGLLRCVWVEKGIEKGGALPFALSGREQNHEAVGERRRANGLSGTNYSLALLHYCLGLHSLLFVRHRGKLYRAWINTSLFNFYPYTSTRLQVRLLYQESLLCTKVQ